MPITHALRALDVLRPRPASPLPDPLILWLPNLLESGAQQVLIAALQHGLARKRLVVRSPEDGPMREVYARLGAEVYVDAPLDTLLRRAARPFVIVNSMIAAAVIERLAVRSVPHAWVVHEWWTPAMFAPAADEPVSVLRHLPFGLDTVERALAACEQVVFMCERQRRLYLQHYPEPRGHSVIYLGLPKRGPRWQVLGRQRPASAPLTFLVMGIVCPRKRQVTTVKLFKRMADERADVLLRLVGARTTREYERRYLDEVRQVIDGDPRIDVVDVTPDPMPHYRTADVLVLLSVSEVTPVVIAEAMAEGLPVIATDIGGTREMFDHGEEGFLVAPDDHASAIEAMRRLRDEPTLRAIMGAKGRARARRQFSARQAAARYNSLIQARLGHTATASAELAPAPASL